MSAHALATRPNPLVRPAPGPRTSEHPTVVPAGDLHAQYSAALVLAETLRIAAERGYPGPAGIGIDADGTVNTVMATATDALAWQPLLEQIDSKNLRLSADGRDIVIPGTRAGRPWTIRTAATR